MKNDLQKVVIFRKGYPFLSPQFKPVVQNLRNQAPKGGQMS